MGNPIVIVTVSQEQAPEPSLLQRTGALVSQGGTSLSAQALSLLTSVEDLAALLPSALSITSIAWASTYGGQATVTTAAAHNVPTGTQFVTTIAGAIPSGYNGTYLAMATGASTFTYYQATNPGTSPASTAGTYTRKGVGDLQAMVTTFFAQAGPAQSVYVLETGAVALATAVSNLSSFITSNSNPQIIYSYLVPRQWAASTDFVAVVANFNNTTSKTYFWITPQYENIALFPDTDKCCRLLVEAPVYGTWALDAFSAATWSGGSVTATTATAHGVKPGDQITVIGNTPAAYNGTFIARPGTTGSTLIYSLTSDPGSNTVLGSLQASIYASTGISATEFSWAAGFARSLQYSPAAGNPVTSFAYSYLYGVTPYPTRGTGPITTLLETAEVSYVASGNEAGLTTAFLKYGHGLDGRPFNYWYSVDWMQINVNLQETAAIVNGSNNPLNPLYLNQRGIDRLQQVAVGVGGSAITFGLALGGPVVITELSANQFADALSAGTYAGQLVVNAIPFTSYFAASPSDYRQGQYDGLSMAYTPQTGFEHIVFNILVTDFVAG